MKMKCPTDVTSVSWGGETFEADSKGVVDVPASAAAALIEHGLEALPEKAPKKTETGAEQ